MAFDRSHRPARPGSGVGTRRRRRLPLLRLASTLLLAACLTVACSAPPQAAPAPTPTTRPRDRPTPTPLPRVVDSGPVVEPRHEVYLTGVTMPVGLTFAPDGRLFFNEAFNGVLRVAERVDGQARLLPQPFAQLVTAKGAEAGMLGVAVHPEFERTRWVYLYYTEPDPNRQDRVPLRNRVVRFTERDNVGTDMTVILDDLAVSRRGVHNGGILRFGPDGKLYVTVGNAEDRSNSQDPKKLNGKILRLNPDGTVPSDNPIPGSPVYAIGFRNPYGLTFEPTTGQAWVSENSGDHDDEINALEPGANYGFPHYEGPGNDPKYRDPVWSSGTRTDGITGLVFYTGDQIPQYRGDLFFCAMNTGALTRLRLGGPERKTVEAGEVLNNNCFLDVVNGPDGALYYSSVNQIFRLGR